MASLIRRGLVNEGLAADVTGIGADAIWMAQAHDYDVLVLDVMLPDIDGFEVCRRLRGAGVWAPVLMLTARDSVEDRVAGPRQRGGRLPRQAVCVRRAAGAAARAHAARRRGASGDSQGRRPPTRSCDARGAPRRDARSPCPPRSSRSSRHSCGVRERCCRGSTCSSTPGTSRTRTGRTSSTCTSGGCGERSTSRSVARLSRPCAAPVTDSRDGAG